MEKKLHDVVARQLADEYDLNDEELDKLKADPIFGLIHRAIRGVVHIAHRAIHFVGGILGKK